MKHFFTKLLHVRTAMMLLLTAVITMTTQTAWADSWPEYITDVVLVGGTESEAQTAKSGYSGYTWCSQKMNEGKGADIIYIGYKTDSRVNTNGGYITDFIIIDAGSGTEGHNPPSSLTFQGRTYYLCPAAGGDYFVNSNHGNLTSQAEKGWNMYLYYTKANFSDKRAVSSITITEGEDTKSGSIDCYKKDGSLIEEDISLNRGVSGTPFVYMHISTVDKTNRPKTDPVMASGLVYNGQEQMLVTSMGTTYESTYKMWFREIGQNQLFYENTYLFTKATNAGEYNVEYFAGSNDYGNQSATKTHQVTIAKSPNSGSYVTCSNYLEGTAPVPELKGTNLSSGTVTYKYSTSQNGTYTTTKPSAAGTYWVKATIAGDSNCYEYTTAATSFNIVYNWRLHNSGDTEDDAYVISTPSDLKYLAIWVNLGTNDFAGKFFKLGADIVFDKSKENNFTPIGNSNYSFRGVFDGKGHTISGLNINKPNNDNVGLFSNAGEGAIIKNLIVDNSTINGQNYVGAILGCGSVKDAYNYGEDPFLVFIENCLVTSSVSVSGTNDVGGIAGTHVAITGSVSAASVSGNLFVAGIIGGNEACLVRFSLYTGTSVTGTGNVGAITGVTSLGFTTNYYTADLSCKGVNGSDADGARKALAINKASGVTLTPTGTATTYNVSGITAYADNNVIGYGGHFYAGATETVNLDITYESPYEGFIFEGYTDGNGNALTHVDGNTYRLDMRATTAYITPAGQDLWGENGTGRDGTTAEKAYRITTPEGLNLLAKKVNGDGYTANNFSGKFFELGEDIAYDKTVENNFTPIGNESHKFSGHFDGKGHTIRGVNIEKSNEGYKGIFGLVYHEQGSAEIKNLTVDDTRIVGKNYCGGIAGRSQNASITNCHVTTSVTISTSVNWTNYHGGIVGYNYTATVTGCTSGANVTFENGTVVLNFGGIAGYNFDRGSIQDCLVYGGNINALGYLGAIVGQNNNGTLTNNYHTINGMGGVGNSPDDTTNSDQDGATVAYEFPDDIQDIIDALGTEGTTYGTGDYTGITAYQNGLKYNGKLYYTSLWTGNGYTASDPYVIYTPEGLDRLAELVNSDNTGVGNFYALGHDIAYDKTALTLDLDGQDGADSNFPGIGDYDKGNYFYGSLDGRGHTISGIVINRPSIDRVGLFATIQSNQSVENLTLANSDITGHDYVGAIAGYGGGRDRTIQNCHVASDVTVTGHDYLGGIVGGSACVLGCTSAANVTGRYMVGGVIGMGDYTTIRDCLYFGNSVTATSASKYVGAIAGHGNNATVEDNYHTCYGHGAVGANQSATGSDTDGARFAVSSTTQPAAITGDATATYGTGTYQGITAYQNGLLYNGRYYWHDDDLMVIDNDGTTNTTAINAELAKISEHRNVVLAGRTLYKDGGWNTIYLPFTVNVANSVLEGATFHKLVNANIEGSTLNLEFGNATNVDDIISKNPYIIKWDKPADYDANPDKYDIKNPVFTNVNFYPNNNWNYDNGISGDNRVRFIGTFDKVTFEDLDRSILFVGAENTLYYPNGEGVTTIGACRAYFKIGEDGAGARQITDFDFNFDGGETTSLTENKRETITNNQWYTLDGRKLDSKPTQKGVYINNGRKVVVK